MPPPVVVKLKIGIAISFLKHGTVPPTNTFDRRLIRFDVKATRSPHGNSTNIGSDLFPFVDDCFDQISCGKTFDDFRLLRRGSWKTVAVNSTHLSRTSTHGFHDERLHTARNDDMRTTLPYTDRIYPMVFVVALGGAIEFCVTRLVFFESNPKYIRRALKLSLFIVITLLIPSDQFPHG